MSTTFYKTNQQITAKEVRLLSSDGTQIGIVPIKEALSKAISENVDLVEIAPLAKPPVVKLIDYKKFIYQLNKKERAAKSAQKKVDLKEIRLTPFMADNDYQTRIDRATEFLSEGHKLRVTVKFVGRQLSRREFGPKLMEKTTNILSDIAQLDQPGKWLGKQYMATFTPVKKSKKNES